MADAIDKLRMRNSMQRVKAYYSMARQVTFLSGAAKMNGHLVRKS